MNSLQHDRLSAENSLHNTIHYTRGSCNCDLMKTNTTLFLVGPECLVLCLVGPGYTWPCFRSGLHVLLGQGFREDGWMHSTSYHGDVIDLL